MARTSTEMRDETRRTLKRAARRLFAEHGVDGVGVREIVEAAGQRNAGALHYYFGTKDELVEELVLDGAKLIDAARQAMLNQMEARGGPHTVREVIRALVLPSLDPNGGSGEQETYLRFILGLQSHKHRQHFRNILANRWADGYQRCLAHLRRLLAPTPVELINQRLVFLGMSMHILLASREEALDMAGAEPHPFWSQPHTIEAVIDGLQAMVEKPPSPELLAAFHADAKAGPAAP